MRFKKKNCCRAISILCLSIIFSCFIINRTEAGEKNKFGILHYPQILEKTKLGKEMKDKLVAKKNKLQTEYDELISEIKKKKEELDKKGLALKADTKIKLEDDIRKKELEAKRMYEDGQRELSNMEKKELAKFNNQVQKIIDKIGEEEGFSFIFQMRGSGIVYASPKVDLTDKVIKELDK